MPSNPKPDRQRHTPKVIAIILYYTILEVNPEAVSALIDLKYGIYKVSPRDCRRRIKLTREQDFPREARSWDWHGVAQEIAECVDYDTFMSLTNIDAECEELLSKASFDTTLGDTASSFVLIVIISMTISLFASLKMITTYAKALLS